MQYVAYLLLILGAWSCADSPTSTESMGRIVLQVSYGEAGAAKTVKVQAVDRMEATISQDGKVRKILELKREGNLWKGQMKAAAGLYDMVLEAYIVGTKKPRASSGADFSLERCFRIFL